MAWVSEGLRPTQSVNTTIIEVAISPAQDKWREVFAIYDSESNDWKTSWFSLLEDDVEFDCPDSGSMRDGECWIRVNPVSNENKNNMWPTPVASDNRDRGNLSLPSIKRRKEMKKQISLSTIVKETSDQDFLNPDWVEWLMGWPIGWTSLKPLNEKSFISWGSNE